MRALILTLDVGTTTVRAQIIDSSAKILKSSSCQVDLLYPQPGYVEIDSESLWNKILKVIRESVEGSGFSYTDISCLAISCQRCSFLTWNRSSFEPYHNFITWKDIRANSIVNKINNSFEMKVIRYGSKLLHLVTGNKRYLAGSVLKLLNTQVTPRLLWVLNNIPSILDDAKKGEVAFGTLDCWLLNKLSDGALHVTDVSHASATGFYDPFTMDWADWAIKFWKIPLSILPTVVDTAGVHFGSVADNIFGVRIPIRSSVADQSASLFGSCCFNEGDSKITMGTGTFLNVVTGKEPYASVAGLYPLAGWKFKDKLVYIAEGASNDTGSVVKWGQDFGLFDNVSDCEQIVNSINGTDGVYFVPAFSGLQAPVYDSQAAAGFIGLKPTSRKEHLLRAILESIVFRIYQLYHVFIEESGYCISILRVDGGVSKNDFVLQFLSDLTKLPVERPVNIETSALGAAFLAGLSSGIWENEDDIKKLRNIEKTFYPTLDNPNEYRYLFTTWCKAIERFYNWYNK